MQNMPDLRNVGSYAMAEHRPEFIGGCHFTTIAEIDKDLKDRGIGLWSPLKQLITKIDSVTRLHAECMESEGNNRTFYFAVVNQEGLSGEVRVRDLGKKYQEVDAIFYLKNSLPDYAAVLMQARQDYKVYRMVFSQISRKGIRFTLQEQIELRHLRHWSITPQLFGPTVIYDDDKKLSHLERSLKEGFSIKQYLVFRDLLKPYDITIERIAAMCLANRG